MNKKILQVFYGADALPYKDKERTVHFPIVGNAIQNANNTTQIKFYFDRLVEENEQTTFVAVSKLPNGKIGSKILETYDDEELGEQYALLDLDSFYTQYKGDVFISLQGYQGGVRVEQDEQGIYQIYGTPVIAATGSIKLAINYAPSFVGSGETENVTLQQVLGELSTKLGVRQETLHVEELPTVGNPDIWYVVNDNEDEPNKQNIYIWNATTQSYVWVGDNTLDLGEYYTKEQGETFEGNVNETLDDYGDRIESVENELSSVAQGSPKGVYSTLSDLETAYPTGTTGIYLVQADGHWYYWNGSAWTDGGVYLSSLPDDDFSKTSTNSLQNAKITNHLDTTKQLTLVDMSSYESGYIASNGTYNSDANWGHLDINVKKNQKVTLTAKGYLTTISMIARKIGTIYRSIVNSIDGNVNEYTFTAYCDMTLTLSFDIRRTYKCKLEYSPFNNDQDLISLMDNKLSLLKPVDMVSNINSYYVDNLGNYTSDANYNSCLLKIKNGETIVLIAKGYLNIISMISKKVGNNYIPLVISQDSNVNTFVYKATEDFDAVLAFDNRATFYSYICYNPYENIMSLIVSKNKFDKSTITDNSRLNSSGQVVSATGMTARFVTDFIPFKKGDVLRDNGYPHNYCLYNSAKAFVSYKEYGIGINGVLMTYDGYVRATVPTQYIDTYIITINNADLVYSPYYNSRYGYNDKKSNILELGSDKQFKTLRSVLDYANANFDSNNPCYILINEGTYNVFEDYTSEEINSAEYTQTGFVGPEVHDGVNLIGIGDKSKIVINGSLETTDYSFDVRIALSTINLKGNCSFENITFKSSNIRYTIHDDFNINANSKHIFKNCDIINEITINSSTKNSYGLGTKSGQVLEFYNCYFKSSFGYHNNTSFSKPSIVRLYNCCVDGNIGLWDLNSGLVSWLELYSTSYNLIGYSQDGVHDVYLKVKNYALSLPNAPTTQGTYKLQCVVDANGEPAFTWENSND